MILFELKYLLISIIVFEIATALNNKAKITVITSLVYSESYETNLEKLTNLSDEFSQYSPFLADFGMTDISDIGDKGFETNNHNGLLGFNVLFTVKDNNCNTIKEAAKKAVGINKKIQKIIVDCQGKRVSFKRNVKKG
uniref:Uncharacterized protein n=1 Tax=Acrobeloides nanus TaxID=290746 RepID=A0A914CQW3_9BILA